MDFNITNVCRIISKLLGNEVPKPVDALYLIMETFGYDKDDIIASYDALNSVALGSAQNKQNTSTLIELGRLVMTSGNCSEILYQKLTRGQGIKAFNKFIDGSTYQNPVVDFASFIEALKFAFRYSDNKARNRPGFTGKQWQSYINSLYESLVSESTNKRRWNEYDTGLHAGSSSKKSYSSSSDYENMSVESKAEQAGDSTRYDDKKERKVHIPRLADIRRTESIELAIEMQRSKLQEDFFETIFFPDIMFEARHYGDIIDVLESTQESVEIIAPGGAGKTVTLLYLESRFLKKEDVLPIYIKLNEINQRPSSTFITDQIARRYLGIYEPNENERKTICRFLFEKGQNFQVLLLLDGFNEISGERIGLISEIRALIKCKTRVVIASRNSVSEAYTMGLGQIILAEFSDKQVNDFLQNQGIPSPGHSRLFAVLKNPFMLSIYVGLSKQNEALDERDITSQAELLNEFFLHERTVFFSGEQKYCHFISVEYLLPAIAYYMEKNLQAFEIDNEEIGKIISDTLVNVVGVDGTAALFSIQQSIDPDSYLQLVETIKTGLLMTKIVSFLKDSSGTLASENKNGLRYHFFRHQIFRDYFCAKYIYHQIQANISISDINTRRLPTNIAENIVEMLGEHRALLHWEATHNNSELSNTPLCKQLEELSLVDTSENNLNHDYALMNVLDMINNSRAGIYGVHFKNLDLTKYPSNGIFFSRKFSAARIKSSFSHCRVNYESFMPPGHFQWVYCLYSIGDKVLSGGRDGYIKIWDTTSEVCSNNILLSFVEIIDITGGLNENSVLCADSEGVFYDLDCSNGQVQGTLHSDIKDLVKTSCEHESGDILSITKSGLLYRFTRESHSLSEVTNFNEEVTCAYFQTYHDYVLCGTKSGSVFRYDFRRGNFELLYHATNAISSVCCNDDDVLLVTTEVFTIVYNLITLEETRYSLPGQQIVRFAKLRSDSNKFLVAYLDNSIYEWDALSRTPILQYIHDDIVNDVLYLDYKTCASCSRDFSVVLTNLIHNETIHVFAGESYWIKRFAYCDSSRLVLVPSTDKTIKIFDEQGGHVDYLEGHTKRVYAVDYISEHSFLVSSSLDSSLGLWNLEERSNICFSEPCGECLDDVAIVDGCTAVSVGSLNSVYLYQINTTAKKLVCVDRYSYIAEDQTKYGTAANSVNWLPKLQVIASTHWDGSVNLLKIADDRLVCINSLSSDGTWAYCMHEHQQATGENFLYLSTRGGNLFRYSLESPESPVIVFHTNHGSLYQFVIIDSYCYLSAGKGYVIAMSLEDYSYEEYLLHGSRVFAILAKPECKEIMSYSEDGTIITSKVQQKKIKPQQNTIKYIQGLLIKDVSFRDCTETSGNSELKNIINSYT